jgi:hypothetical protein
MNRFLAAIFAFVCVSGMVQSGAAAATPEGNAPVGVVSHINLISDKSEDVSSLEAWKKTYIKEGMTDQEKALAIWRTVVRYRHQTDPPCEFFGSEANVHDPLKTIHVYGYGMCCCASSNVDGLARYLGYRSRCLGIGHMIAEVFYDNAWHMLDGSLQNYFRKPDGAIASADEICAVVKPWLDQHPDLRSGGRGDVGKLQAFAAGGRWKKDGPPLLATCNYFDNDGKGWGTHGWFCTMFYYDCKPGDYETYPSMGYQLNVQLREGEKITRNWRAGGSIGGADPVIVTPAGRAALRLQESLGDKAPGRVGCGEMVYDVPLAGGAFRGGALKVENLTSTDGKGKPALAVTDAAKDGELVLRFPSSYVYVSSPRKDKGTPATVELDAALGEGGKVEAFFSDNHELTWQPLAAVKAGKNTIDLDFLPFRKYDYQLKLVLKGAGTGLAALKVTNPFQCSQAALPTITGGDNTITFKAGPPEGTVTFEGNTLADAKWEWKQLTYLSFKPEVKNIAKGLARVLQGKGEMTFTMPTPGDITRVRMNVGFRCRDVNDSWTIAMSFDGGKTFADVEKITGPTPGCTKYIVYDKAIPKGAREVRIRMSGKEVNATCLFGLRMDADYVEPAGGFKPVRITYVWDEAGKEMKDEHVCTKAEETYKITCGTGAVVKSFAMELAK